MIIIPIKWLFHWGYTHLDWFKKLGHDPEIHWLIISSIMDGPFWSPISEKHQIWHPKLQIARPSIWSSSQLKMVHKSSRSTADIAAERRCHTFLRKEPNSDCISLSLSMIHVLYYICTWYSCLYVFLDVLLLGCVLSFPTTHVLESWLFGRECTVTACQNIQSFRWLVSSHFSLWCENTLIGVDFLHWFLKGREKFLYLSMDLLDL